MSHTWRRVSPRIWSLLIYPGLQAQVILDPQDTTDVKTRWAETGNEGLDAEGPWYVRIIFTDKPAVARTLRENTPHPTAAAAKAEVEDWVLRLVGSK